MTASRYHYHSRGAKFNAGPYDGIEVRLEKQDDIPRVPTTVVSAPAAPQMPTQPLQPGI